MEIYQETVQREQIVVKRGNLKIQYPSNEMSKKLWKTLEKRFEVRALEASCQPRN